MITVIASCTTHKPSFWWFDHGPAVPVHTDIRWLHVLEVEGPVAAIGPNAPDVVGIALHPPRLLAQCGYISAEGAEAR